MFYRKKRRRYLAKLLSTRLICLSGHVIEPGKTGEDPNAEEHRQRLHPINAAEIRLSWVQKTPDAPLIAKREPPPWMKSRFGVFRRRGGRSVGCWRSEGSALPHQLFQFLFELAEANLEIVRPGRVGRIVVGENPRMKATSSAPGRE